MFLWETALIFVAAQWVQELHFLNPQHLLFSGIYSDVQCRYSFAHKLWQIQYIISAPADSFQPYCPCCGINATQLKNLPWACPCNIWLASLSVIHCILSGHRERALSSIYPTYALMPTPAQLSLKDRRFNAFYFTVSLILQLL